MADPERIHPEPVDDIHDGQDHKQLPEAGCKAPCPVDRVDHHQHIGDVAGEADSFELQAAARYRFAGRQAQFHAALLHFRAVEMHHLHRAFADAERTDQDQQKP